MAETIAGITVPDTPLVRDVTEYIRDTEDDLLYHHSRRVFLFGALQGRARGLEPDLELLYTSAMFHDLGLTPGYRGVPEFLDPVIALLNAGVATDVLGLGYDDLTDEQRGAVTSAHPRPDFKNRILRAFTDGNVHRPETTFGNMNADVLQHYMDGFERADFVQLILDSPWPE